MRSYRRARVRTITFWQKLWKVLNTPIHVLWEHRWQIWTDPVGSTAEHSGPTLPEVTGSPLDDAAAAESTAVAPNLQAETERSSNTAEPASAPVTNAASVEAEAPAAPHASTDSTLAEPPVPEPDATAPALSDPTSSGLPALIWELPSGQATEGATQVGAALDEATDAEKAAPVGTAGHGSSLTVPQDENTRISVLPAAPLIDFSRVFVTEDLALQHLREGASVFNAWRDREHHVPLMLVNTDFSGIDLQGVDWRGCVLVHADFSTADLSNARFDEAVLKGCNFGRAVLDGAHFETQDPQEITSAGLGVLLSHPEVASGSSWARFQVDFGVTLVGQPRKRAKKVRQGLKIENRTKDTLRFSIAVYENEWPLFATEHLLNGHAWDEIALIFSQPANMEELTLHVQVFPSVDGAANKNPDRCIGTFESSPFTGSKKRTRTMKH